MFLPYMAETNDGSLNRVWPVPEFLGSEKFIYLIFWENEKNRKGLRYIRYRKARAPPVPSETRGAILRHSTGRGSMVEDRGGTGMD